MSRNREIHIYILIIIAMLMTASCTRQDKAPGKTVSVSRNAIEMGTAAGLTLYADTAGLSEADRRQQLAEEAGEILAVIESLDQNVLSWRSETSEVFRFNQSDAGIPVEISPELEKALSESLAIAAETRGAMDITLRTLIAAWGIESYDGTTAYVPPSEDTLAEIAGTIGFGHLSLSGNVLSKDIGALELDLGAIGKGFALDLAAERFAASEISGAVLAVGGSILTYGDKGESWQIGIRDPEGSPSDYLAILSIPGEAKKTTFVSTSGGYEKYAEANGQIYEHIIDGRTLYPPESDLYSVTVVTSDSGLASDALSTACYVLGMEGSAGLLSLYHAEAIFVFRGHTVTLSSGLKDQLALTGPNYTIAGTID